MTAEVKQRRYDLYISGVEPIRLKQVLFMGNRRMVIKEELSREDWDAERALPSRPGTTAFRGRFTAGVNGAIPAPKFDGSPAPGQHHAFFYGVDWL